ncbi:hypothetical protein [Aquimarina rhabdastrellae]
MTQKRSSLLIDDDSLIQEQSTFISKNDKEDSSNISITDNEKEQESEYIPFKRKLHYWSILNKTRFLHRTYGIKINYNNQKRIQYLLEVKCEGYKKDIFTYTLVRKRFFKDGKELDSTLEQLAEKSANCLYPLQVSVNQQGQIIAIANQKEIQERWETLKLELSKLYTGEPFQKYCSRMDKAVNNSKEILRSMNNDVLYDILFSKLYLNYSKTHTQPVVKEFKWFSRFQKVRFIGNQVLNPVIKENMRVCIDYKGTMQGIGNLSQGETNIQYQLDSKDHTLLRVDGIFNYTKNITNKTIHFSAIWQQNMDKTQARKIEDEKRRDVYIPEGAKWWQIWK